MNRMIIRAAAVALLYGCAVADQPVATDPCVDEYLSAYAAGRRLEAVDGCDWATIESQDRADAIQAAIAAHHPAGGKAVGYKVTNAQDGRVVGVITDAMLLPSGSTVDLSTGTRLLGEGDLLVRVRSAAINDATTLEDIAAGIDQVIPFIESSDMMLPDGASRTKAIWTASNGNARWGVRGDAVDVSGIEPARLVEMLGSLEVELIDESGKTLQKSGMRNNPLQSVIDVLDDMRRRGGVRLEAGDLISLGNFGRPRFPTTGNDITAVFHGLADPAPTITARYRQAAD